MRRSDLRPLIQRFHGLRDQLWRLRVPLLLSSLAFLYLVGLARVAELDLVGLGVLVCSAALWDRTIRHAARTWALRHGRERFTSLLDSLVSVSALGWLGICVLLIVTPRFGDTFDKAYMTAMKSDLRNFSRAQELRMGGNEPYADVLEEMDDFRSNEGVSIEMTSVTGSGGVALATHDHSRARCAVAWGDAVNPIDSTRQPGVPICRAKYGLRTVLR